MIPSLTKQCVKIYFFVFIPNQERLASITIEGLHPNTPTSCLDLHFHKILHIFINENPGDDALSPHRYIYHITFQTIEMNTVWLVIIDNGLNIKQVINDPPSLSQTPTPTPPHTPQPVSASKRGPKFSNLQPRTQNFGSVSTSCEPTVTWYYPMEDIPVYLLKRSKNK